MTAAPRPQRLLTLGARLLTLALAGLVGWTAWDGYQRLTAPPPQPRVHAPAGAGTPAQAPRSAPRRGEEIAALHLFGAPETAAPEPALPAPAEAPETRLNLELMGVLSSSSREGARAIITASNHPEKHYRVGDRLPAGATIAEIHDDSVLLERNGRYETLRLRRERTGDRARPGTPASPSASLRRLRAASPRERD